MLYVYAFMIRVGRTQGWSYSKASPLPHKFKKKFFLYYVYLATKLKLVSPNV